MSELRSAATDDEEIIVVGSSDGATATASTVEHLQNTISTSNNITAMVDSNFSSGINRQNIVPEESIPSNNSNTNNNTSTNSSTDVCDNLPSCSRKANLNTPSTSSGMSDDANSASGSSVRTENEEANNPSSSCSSSNPVLECPICLLTCVHPTRLPCGHIFCYLCVKGVANKNHRCAMCRRNIPPEFLEHPQLVNGTEDICSTKATDDGYQWFYEGRNGWWQYDDRTSQDIEEAFKKGEKSCTILVAGYVYIVDLEAMLQQRQNEPSRCRRVKRDLATIPKKGVAGLRIEGGNVTAEISSSHYNQTFTSQQQQHQLILPLGFVVVGDQQPLADYDYQDSNNSSNSEMHNISTIAATDAAIRIASDIIGSTLAHADELTRRRSSMPSLAPNNSSGIEDFLSGEQNSLITSNSISNSIPVSSSTTMLPSSSSSTHSSLNNATSPLSTTRPLFASNDQRRTIDFIEQTLNDFHALTLRNIVDSSDDENNHDGGNNGDEDEDNIHNIARHILATSTVVDDSSDDTNSITPINTTNTSSTLSASNNSTTASNIASHIEQMNEQTNNLTQHRQNPF